MIGTGVDIWQQILNQNASTKTASVNTLLLEDGFNLLLEDGTRLVLETEFVVDEFGNNVIDEFNNFLVG